MEKKIHEKNFGNSSEKKVLVGNRYGLNYEVSDRDEVYDKYFLYDQGLWSRYIGFSTMADYDDYKVHLLIENTTGIKYKKISSEERKQIIESQEYEKMPSWPNDGCINKINEVLVVKIS